MAIYRNIQMTFWTDIKVSEHFTPEDKYFYLYLFTNPHTNLAGCYEVSIRQASIETGYSKETIERLFKRFAEVHKVAFYSAETSEVLLVNWHKYNWTSSEKFRKPLETQIKNIKNQNFMNYLTEIFMHPDTVSIPYTYPIDTYCIDTSVSVSVSDTVYKNNNSINNNITNYIYTEHFEEVYNLYPRKEGKKKAYECYKARLKEGYSEDELLKATKNYAAECEKEKREKRYIKMASTFFGVNTPFVDFLKGGDSDDGDNTETIELTDEELEAYEGFKLKGFM